MKRFLMLVVVVTITTLFSGVGSASAANTTSVWGDADCSSNVDASDMLAVPAFAGDVETSPCVWTGDVNCDEKIDVSDALAIGLNVAGVTHPTGGCNAIGQPILEQGLLSGSTLDFEVFGKDNVGQGDGSVTTQAGVGDTYYNNLGRRGVFGFDITGVQAPITAATLSLRISETSHDQFPNPGIIDDSPPFTNPNLGDLRVLHVSEDTLIAHAGDGYGSPSIGNDPGVIVPAGVEAERVISIDVRAALQQALDSGAGHVAFRIQTATESDDDSMNDTFNIDLGASAFLAYRPQIVYTVGP
jgi:hypothetical protein